MEEYSTENAPISIMLKEFPATVWIREGTYDFDVRSNKVLVLVGGCKIHRHNIINHDYFIEIIASSSKRLTAEQIEIIQRYFIKDFGKRYHAGR